MYYYRSIQNQNNYNWSYILELLNYSLYLEKMICSMTTQLFYIEETEDLKGNPEMHQHLVPASYHRVTAVGSALRLQKGEFEHSILMALKSCVSNALNEDEEVKKWLDVMFEDAPANYKAFMQQVIYMHDTKNYYTKAVADILEINNYYNEVEY